MNIKTNKEIKTPLYVGDKIIKKVGNGANVIIPKEYIGSRAYVVVYND